MVLIASLYYNNVKISLRIEIANILCAVFWKYHRVKEHRLNEHRDEHVGVKAEIAQKATMLDSNHRTIEGLF